MSVVLRTEFIKNLLLLLLLQEELEAFYNWDDQMVVIKQHRANQTTGQRSLTTIRQDYRFVSFLITIFAFRN